MVDLKVISLANAIGPLLSGRDCHLRLAGLPALPWPEGFLLSLTADTEARLAACLKRLLNAGCVEIGVSCGDGRSTVERRAVALCETLESLDGDRESVEWL